MIDGSVNLARVRTFIIGFAAAARSAAEALLRQGQPSASLLIVTRNGDQAAAARSLGLG